MAAVFFYWISPVLEGLLEYVSLYLEVVNRCFLCMIVVGLGYNMSL